MKHGDVAVLTNFAHNLVGYSGEQTPFQIAVQQGWIDKAGKPTTLGLELAVALEEQQNTRSVFRAL